jgi:RNA polymerase sigma factor (sigma-70 family)
MYQEHSGSVFSFALRRSTFEEAKDLTAETFRVAWERLDAVPEKPLPYLYGIARRLLANQRRAQTRRVALFAKLSQEAASRDPHAWEGTVTPTSVHGPADETIRMAASHLPMPDQDVLALTYWEGLSAPEVAGVLGCSRAAVLVRLHRARRRLAVQLALLEPERVDPEGESPAEEPR